MGEFEIATGVMHMALLAPHMVPLEHVWNSCNSNTTSGWKKHHYTNRLEVSGALLSQQDFILRDYTVTASIAYLPGDENTLANAASHIWYLTDIHLLSILNLHLPQIHSWKIFLVPSEVRQNITNMLRNRRTATGSAQAGPETVPPPGGNGWTSAHGLQLAQTSLGSTNPFHIYKCSHTASEWAQ